MGQQQILLLVVAAIVVVIAITIGIDMFGANAQSSNRDSIVSELNNLGTLALQFYRKSPPMVEEVYHSIPGQFRNILIQLQTECIV